MSVEQQQAVRAGIGQIGLAIVWFSLAVLQSNLCSAQQPRSFWVIQPSQPLPPPAGGANRLPPQPAYSQPSPDAPVETLPPPAPGAAGATPQADGCPPAPVDLPLGELIADITPRDISGEPVPPAAIPLNCASDVFDETRFVAILPGIGPGGPHLCELLQLAAFCHRPLYFEEALLERHGIRTCCVQPLASACQFYGRALLLPISMMHQCPCSLVPSAHPCD